MEHTRRWTAREVRQLIADAPSITPRYELVDGELLVTPAPSPRHQEAVALLLVAPRQYCDRTGAAHVLTSPSAIEIEPEDVRQPDVFLMPIGEWHRVALEGWPARRLSVAIEVISPSSARYDRVVKRAKYNRLVSEYWIVDTDARVVERWRTGDDRPEILSDRLVWQPAAASDRFELDLVAFFARVNADANHS